MPLTSSLLTVLLCIVTATAQKSLSASLSYSHGGLGSAPVIAERDAPEHVGPPLSVLQEVVRKVVPPNLWDALYEDLTEELFEGSGDVETQEDGQLHINWLRMLAPYYLPALANVSSECRRDVNAISEGIISQKDWAEKIVDSWGKLPDGILVGNIIAMGLLDECLMTTVDSQDPEAHFRGQYCSFSVTQKRKSLSEEEEEEEEEEAMQPELRIANVKGILEMAVPSNRMATCIPSTCTKDEYGISLAEELEKRNLQLVMLECQTKDLPTLLYNTADIIMIITLVIMGILVLIGTMTDVWILIFKDEELAMGPLRYFLVFSFYTNLSKIFRINVNESEEVISCLHGIRVLSMCWVVLAHSFLFSISVSANKGLLGQMVEEHPYFYQVILNGYPSVDTFFLMSGLLVAYNLTKEFHRTGKFNAPLYYVHRFIRLAPPIMLLSGFLAVFPPLFVQGSVSPMLVDKGNMVDNCIKYWWRDSFFLTNAFVGKPDGQSCIPVCWYTAVDFQLYIVTPLMFLPLLYRRKPGMVVFGVFLVASVVFPMSIIGAFKLPPNNVMDGTPGAMGDNMKYVYSKPWCRASPYLVGLALGYFLRVVDREKLNMQLKWWQAVLGWVVALAIMSAVIFGLADYNTLSGTPHEYVPAVSILYGGLHRLAWGVAVAWMVFACHMGYGGPINSVLAHPMWQPLSRLTYTIFLIALNAQSLYYNYYSRLPIYFTPFYKVMETTGVLVISSFGAVLLSLLAESPVLGLEKLLLRKTR